MAGDARITDPASPGTNSCSNCGSVNLSTSEACSFCGHELPRHHATISPGDRIGGKYEVLSLLGVGGMGEVFKVRHLSLEDTRCIKLMRSDVMDNEQFRARFLREARVATRIHHPNVAVIHDFDTSESGQHFLVSEFIDGITIRQWSRRHGRFPVDLAVHLVLQVLSGLRHIHARGLLHRDISGDNIMITLDHDELPLAKIIDLGIAKLVGGTSDMTHATQVGSFVGNPKYSSPEQLGMLDDDESLDARTDIYSLGVVFYEMLTGRPPFTSRSPQGYLAKHLTQLPPPFSEVASDLVAPEGLEDVVRRSLEKNRDSRYDSARSFAIALRQFDVGTNSDLASFGERIIGDLPSRQAHRLLHDTIPPVVDRSTIPDRPVGSEPEQVSDSGPTIVARTEVNPEAIEAEAWRNAEEENTRFSYEQYLLLFPEGRHHDDAQRRVHELVDVEMIGALQSGGEMEALGEIAGDRSRSPSVRSAAEEAMRHLRRSRDETVAAWKIASSLGSVSEIERFIREHPEFDRIDKARDLLEQVRTAEEARSSDETGAWERYLERWPEGRFAAEARDALDEDTDEKEFRESVSEPSTSRFRTYLRNFPDGRFRKEALKYLEESLAWDQMGWIRRDLEQYLEIYPDGLHANEARERLAKLDADQAS